MKIIVAEWAGYPLKRFKHLGDRRVDCGLGRLLAGIARWPAGVDFDVHLVINTQAPHAPTHGPLGLVRRWAKGVVGIDLPNAGRSPLHASLPEQYPFIRKMTWRPNDSMDLGAYDHGYQQLRAEGYEGEVLFVNSSATGPTEPNWLLKYRDQFRLHDNVGLCGISLNSHDTTASPAVFAPHVQSFFLLTSMQVLTSAVGESLLPSRLEGKLDVIRRGEIGISQRVLSAGYAITCGWFPGFSYRLGQPWTIPEGDLRFDPRFAKHANAI